MQGGKDTGCGDIALLTARKEVVRTRSSSRTGPRFHKEEAVGPTEYVTVGPNTRDAHGKKSRLPLQGLDGAERTQPFTDMHIPGADEARLQTRQAHIQTGWDRRPIFYRKRPKNPIVFYD